MKSIWLFLAFLIFAGEVQAGEKVCISEAIAQTQEKISQHYNLKSMKGELSSIQTVDLDHTVRHITQDYTGSRGIEIEPVAYKEFLIVGMLEIEGEIYKDYAFYVRVNPTDCSVLKVALLNHGSSIFMTIIPSAPPGQHQEQRGLSAQAVTLDPIPVQREGSPEIGFTYIAKEDEPSVLVLRSDRLFWLQQRAVELVRKE